MPVAAIESLVELLSVTDAETVYETLDLINTQSALLKSKIPNSISLTAGLDLFRQFIMNMLKPTSNFSGNFEAIRTHLVTNGTTFVGRAKNARQSIANWGQHFIRDGHTVMTHGGSRVVAALLTTANLPDRPGGNVRFNVIYVMNQARLAECQAVVDSLRAVGIPVAEIDESAVAYTMSKVDLVIVGAEGVVENGGIISRLGTYQLALVAKHHDKKFLVAAETHKFVRLFPLTQDDIGDQRIVEFMEVGDTTARASLTEAVDYTHPDFISAIITENGPRTTSAVTEELIYIHYS
jgi:translation initiation factor eIF-2B subunit alpha